MARPPMHIWLRGISMHVCEGRNMAYTQTDRITEGTRQGDVRLCAAPCGLFYTLARNVREVPVWWLRSWPVAQVCKEHDGIG